MSLDRVWDEQPVLIAELEGSQDEQQSTSRQNSGTHKVSLFSGETTVKIAERMLKNCKCANKHAPFSFNKTYRSVIPV